MLMLEKLTLPIYLTVSSLPIDWLGITLDMDLLLGVYHEGENRYIISL